MPIIISTKYPKNFVLSPPPTSPSQKVSSIQIPPTTKHLWQILTLPSKYQNSAFQNLKKPAPPHRFSTQVKPPVIIMSLESKNIAK